MKLDVTDLVRKKDSKFYKEGVKWLSANIGKITINDKYSIQGDTWRISTTIATVDGFYETAYWLEFDHDKDVSAFLLRWA